MTFFKNDNYRAELDKALPGQDCSAGFSRISNSYMNKSGGNISFGVFVSSAAHQEATVLVKGVDVNTIAGVTIQNNYIPNPLDGAAAYEPDRALTLMEEGDIYMRTVKAASSGGVVHVVTEGENAGLVSGVASATDGEITAELKGCHFIDDALDGEMVRVRIRSLRTRFSA